VHQRVLREAKDWVESQGWRVLGVTESPITGPRAMSNSCWERKRMAEAASGDAGRRSR
jgi:23S rRNA (cytidine1920-2'-O)/16S rRNA (cytidine1409-2'-O)-methyltransferase